MTDAEKIIELQNAVAALVAAIVNGDTYKTQNPYTRTYVQQGLKALGRSAGISTFGGDWMDVLSKFAASGELTSAQRELTQKGYESFIDQDGNLIVKDPEHRSGPGGTLVHTGFKNVRIKDYRQAIRFIDARS